MMDKNEEKTDEASHKEVLTVTTMLLLQVLDCDGDGRPQCELDQLVDSLSDIFGISPTDAGDLLEVSEYLLKDRESADRAIEKVLAHLSAQDKQNLLVMAWRIFAADSRLSKGELDKSVKIRTLLGLTLEEAVHARSVAEKVLEEFRSNRAKRAKIEEEGEVSFENEEI